MNHQNENHSNNGHRSQAFVTDVKQMLGQDTNKKTPSTGLIEPEAVWQQPNQSASTPNSADPNNTPVPKDIIESFKTEIWELTNTERHRKGLPPLRWSPQLNQAAQGHAEDMARNGFCNHRGSDGSSVSERVTAVGYSFFGVGENIAAGQTNAAEVVSGWMKSPEDCKNILNPDHTEIGLGHVSAPSSSHRYYWVQVFGRGSGEPQVTHPLDPTEKPDFWNYAAVSVFMLFYAASLISTYVSTNLLLYLLSGGANIFIPMFGTQIPIAEAVSVMGTGILEGSSLSDAYLEQKKCQTKGSKLARHLAFVAQGLLYYMALGQLLFAAADVSSLGAQGLQDYEKSSRTQASLVLEPPTLLHGAFVGTISFAWSFGTTYLGPTALLIAIERLRRKRLQKAQQTPDLNNASAPLQGDQQVDVTPLLEYWYDQITKGIQIYLQNELMKHQVEELKTLQRAIDKGMIEIANLPEEIRQLGLPIAQRTPNKLYELAGMTFAQGELLFKQPASQAISADANNTPPIPDDWHQ